MESCAPGNTKAFLILKQIISSFQGAMGWAYQGGIDDIGTINSGLLSLKGRTDKALVNFTLL